MKQTVAAYIAKMLEQAGVKRIWGAVSYTHLGTLSGICATRW